MFICASGTAPRVSMCGARRLRWAPWRRVLLLLGAGGWSATPQGVRASELVSSDTVVVCTVDGRVHALDSSSGDAKWSVELGDPLLSSWSLAGASSPLHPNFLRRSSRCAHTVATRLVAERNTATTDAHWPAAKP